MLGIVLRLLLLATSMAAVTCILFAFQAGQFVTPVRVALYGWLPALISGFLLLLAISKNIQRQILAIICGAALLTALFGTELYLQIETNGFISSASKGKVIGILKQEPEELFAGGHVCPHTLLSYGKGQTPVEFDGKPVLPLSGLANNELAAVDGEDAPWPSDRHGFNNPDNVWDSDVMVMAIGDSFTAGGDVPIGAGYVDYIRSHFRGTINLGCGGNGPITALATLTEYGPVAKPKFLVWGYYEGNDLTKDILREVETDLVQYLSVDYRQNLPTMAPSLFGSLTDTLRRMADTKSGRTPPPHASRSSFNFHFSSVITLTQLRTALGLSLRIDNKALELFEKVIRQIRAQGEVLGSQVLFIYIPAEVRYLNIISNLDANSFKSEVLDRAKAAGFSVLDGDKIIGKVAEPRQLYQGHFTKEGYKLLGQAVVNRIAGMLGNL